MIFTVIRFFFISSRFLYREFLLDNSFHFIGVSLSFISMHISFYRILRAMWFHSRRKPDKKNIAAMEAKDNIQLIQIEKMVRQYANSHLLGFVCALGERSFFFFRLVFSFCLCGWFAELNFSQHITGTFWCSQSTSVARTLHIDWTSGRERERL